MHPGGCTACQLSPAEWNLLAYYVRHGVEAFSSQTLKLVSRVALVAVRDAFPRPVRPAEETDVPARRVAPGPPRMSPWRRAGPRTRQSVDLDTALMFPIVKRTALIAPAFLTLIGSTPAAAQRPVHKAIIALTYDDALESQLSVAIPQLNSIGLKGTFFLNSIGLGFVVIGTSPPVVLGWRKAAQAGHELGNHTLLHVCPEKLGWETETAVDYYTVQRVLKEVAAVNTMLSLLDERRKTRSYAYPCNNSLASGVDYAAALQKSRMVKYGRTGGNRQSVIVDFKTLNLMKVPSWPVEEGTTSEELIDFAERVKKAGGMGVYQFHGIGGPLFKVTGEAHQKLLQYLNDNQADYWVTTFSEAMDSLTAKRGK
jgi:peptidoglycan-N-acetylglucosamine deacetylase